MSELRSAVEALRSEVLAELPNAGIEEDARYPGGPRGGELSLSAARVLVGAREADPRAFERGETMLVEAARIHEVGDLQ